METQVMEERQIKNQITLLTNDIYSLSDSMAKLLKRLGPALRVELPCVTPKDKAVTTSEAASLVDIAESVRQVRYSVGTNMSMIGDILHRLEI